MCLVLHFSLRLCDIYIILVFAKLFKNWEDVSRSTKLFRFAFGGKHNFFIEQNLN